MYPGRERDRRKDITGRRAGDRMRIGFIGAGKVGFTMGRHLKDAGQDVTGYYNRNLEAADEAAFFTGTVRFDSLKEITDASDVLFLTVSDGAISTVWNSLKELDLRDKIICHTSGSLSSQVFEGIEEKGAFGYSIHPLFAVYSKTESYRDFSKCFITIEGHEKYIGMFQKMFQDAGHRTEVIPAEHKMRYHAAAVFASNFVAGTLSAAQDMFETCGFSEDAAREALLPIFTNNCQNIAAAGPVQALTGPVERNDAGTVAQHLKVLTEDEKAIYVAMSRQLLKLAEKKNPQRDYEDTKKLLDSER